MHAACASKQVVLNAHGGGAHNRFGGTEEAILAKGHTGPQEAAIDYVFTINLLDQMPIIHAAREHKVFDLSSSGNSQLCVFQIKTGGSADGAQTRVERGEG